MRKARGVFRILAVLAIGAGVISAPGQDMDKKLNNYFHDYLETQFRHQPLEATQLGDHRFDSLLDDLSREALAARRVRDVEALEALPRRIDHAQLSRNGQIDYEIFRHDLTRSIWRAENLHPFEDDPRVYGSYLSDSVYHLLTQSTLPKETNIANCLARMEQIPRVVAAAKANLRQPARPLLETAIRQNQGSIAFYEKDIFEFAGKTPRLASLKVSAQRVAACLKEYQGFLEKDLLPRATGDWRLGRDKFCRKFELDMDANLTADQVLAEAQAEFDRVQRDMYVVARQLWSAFYSGRALPPDDAAGRRETIQRVLDRIGEDHGRPETLTRDVRKAVTQIKRFISERDILRLPDPDSCRVVEMPEFQRGNSTAYMNSPPPLDSKALGYYAVSPPPKDWSAQRVKSYLEEYNRYMLQILTIHEAYPGHYVQFEYSNRNPSSIRRVLQSGVFIEGWAVYTEQTMLDEGYGRGDLALRLTQLKFYLRAVANTILDHQMHCAEMTDEEALRFLTGQAYQSTSLSVRGRSAHEDYPSQTKRGPAFHLFCGADGALPLAPGGRA
jgi:uncharacterized protein (DUF885 family)